VKYLGGSRASESRSIWSADMSMLHSLCAAGRSVRSVTFTSGRRRLRTFTSGRPLEHRQTEDVRRVAHHQTKKTYHMNAQKRMQKNSVSKTIISTSNMKEKRNPLPHSEGEKKPETCAALSYPGIERTIIDYGQSGVMTAQRPRQSGRFTN
jgi:hypothetical protein